MPKYMAFGDFCSRNYPLPLLHCGSKIIASFHHSITMYYCTTSYLIELLQLQLEVVLRCGHSRPPAAAAAATAQAPPGQPASPTFVAGGCRQPVVHFADGGGEEGSVHVMVVFSTHHVQGGLVGCERRQRHDDHIL